MKTIAAAALTLLSLMPAARAADAVCNVAVDVTDTDPKGLNVRATPGGKVIATLKDTGDWIMLQIAAQQGDWYAISAATQIDNAHGDKTIFHGMGYVHKSTVGLSGLQNGAVLYARHDIRSDIVVAHADGDQTTQLLGCWHDFYLVRITKGTGWTKTVCTNEDTTCV
ncbi:MAG TPA: hypothetical protein VNU97_01665 [Rhizomicrobium sp.]|jgi:hypothetical protein|nr:hypothetical protein [Rhizomicrobium sp.]